MSDGPASVPPSAAAPTGADSGSSEPGQADRDVLFVAGHDPTRNRFKVLRNRAGQLEVGEMGQLEEGKPIHGEVVNLKPTDDERLFDVEVVAEAPGQRRAQPRSGPAQVASDRYRRQWDRIFGSAKKKRGRELN